MSAPTAVLPARRRTAALLAALLALGALVRVTSYLQVRDGAIHYFHWAADTDMHFFDGWARTLAGGEWLAAPLPYHPWHHEVARDVQAMRTPGRPFDEADGRRLWRHWMGDN